MEPLEGEGRFGVRILRGRFEPRGPAAGARLQATLRAGGVTRATAPAPAGPDPVWNEVLVGVPPPQPAQRMAERG